MRLSEDENAIGVLEELEEVDWESRDEGIGRYSTCRSAMKEEAKRVYG